MHHAQSSWLQQKCLPVSFFFSFPFLFSVCFKALLQSKKLHSFCLLAVNLSFQNIKPYFFVAENTAVALSCKLHLVSVEKYNHKILGKLPILPLVLCCQKSPLPLGFGEISHPAPCLGVYSFLVSSVLQDYYYFFFPPEMMYSLWLFKAC